MRVAPPSPTAAALWQTAGVLARLFRDPVDVVEPAAGLVQRDPFTTTVIAVQLAGVLDGSRPRVPGEVWAVVTDGDEVVGLAMQTPPHHVAVSAMAPAAAGVLADALARVDQPVSGVNGEQAAAAAFAAAYAAATGRGLELETAMRLYRLERLEEPGEVPGSSRPATGDDRALVRAFFEAFSLEATPHQPTDDLEALADRRLDGGRLDAWVVGDEVVALAGHTAPVHGVARVGPVYTPPARRRHGYGAAVTAATTRRALDEGAGEVVLYTDLANPTSNAIYQKLGYRPHHDAAEWGLRP